MPSTKWRNTLYTFLLPLLSPNCSTHPISSVTGHPIGNMRSLESLFRKYHVLGSATLLSTGSTSSLVLTTSDKPLHTAAEDTFFRVASITKVATAILTVRLTEQGLLDLDTPVSEYMSSIDRNCGLEGISLRHLLSHTSGLSDPPDLEKKLESGTIFPDFIGNFRTGRPGDSFRYSNLGYGLIGCILEAITDKPLGTVYQDFLFRPLDMNATMEGCLLDRQKIMPVTRILPYHNDSGLILTSLGLRPLLHTDPLRHYGHSAGSMYTDIRSLHRLLSVLSDNRFSFLSEQSVTMMKTVHASYGKISPNLSYGLGLLIINDPFLSHHTIYGHQGFAYGCADGAFWEEDTQHEMITLNGGCSEARVGRLGASNRGFLRFAFQKELPSW